MSNQFPSSYSGEISPVSSVDKRPKRKAVQKKQEEDESIFDEEDEAEKKAKKNKRALGIQSKVISKPKPLDSKFKKLGNSSQP